METHSSEACTQELKAHAKNKTCTATTEGHFQRFHHFCLDCAIFSVENIWRLSVIFKMNFTLVFLCPCVPGDFLISFLVFNLCDVHACISPCLASQHTCVKHLH